MLNKIGEWVIKQLIKIIMAPEGEAIDFSKAKMGKVAFRNQTQDDLKKIEAIRTGVEHLKKLKQQME